MYNAYEFTFAGEPASMYGMFVADFGNSTHSDNSFGNVGKIVETRIARRTTPLHYGVRYHDDPLRFTLIFGSEHEMDRYQLQEAADWLTGYQEYQWLSIDQPDMEHIQFRCLIEKLTPISVGWLPFAFEAEVVCDCPYGYSYPFTQQISVDGRTTFRFYNGSTVKCALKPELRVALAPGCEEFTVRNKTSGTETKLTGLPAGGITIIMDNENEILVDESGSGNLYNGFNFQFFSLLPGDNYLEFDGVGEVVMCGRFLYNVGA